MEMCKVCREIFEEDTAKIKNGCCDNCNDLNIQEKKDYKIKMSINQDKKSEEFNFLYYSLGIGLTIIIMILFKNNKIEIEYIFYFIGIIIFIPIFYMIRKLFIIILILMIGVCSIYGIIYYPLQIIAILLFLLVFAYFIKN
jgi:hypothetical protein